MRKKCYFGGTNSRFLCKQRTYKSSMCKKTRNFDAKRTQIGAKNGQKPPFIWLRCAVRGQKKRCRAIIMKGARRASNSSMRALETRCGRGPAPGQATAVAQCDEVLGVLLGGFDFQMMRQAGSHIRLNRWPPTAFSRVGEGGVKVGDKIADILEAHGYTNQVGRDPHSQLDLAGHRGMSHRGRMLDERLDSS